VLKRTCKKKKKLKKRTLVHHWWRFLKKLKIELPYYLTITPAGIYQRK
jgi:hypothetical protein